MPGNFDSILDILSGMLRDPASCLNPTENVGILILAHSQPGEAKNSDQLSVSCCSDVISIFKNFAMLYMPASKCKPRGLSGIEEVVYPTVLFSKSLV